MPFEKKLAAGALVEILDPLGGGQVVGLGFRILDDVIATACRCLPFCQGMVVLPDPDGPVAEAVLVRLRRPGGTLVVLAEVISADPSSDLALLGLPRAGGGLASPPASPAPLEALLADLAVAPLQWVPFQEGPITICNHEGRWIEGTARATSISIPRPSERIRSATAGAPVFDRDGRVVGLVGHNDVRLPEATMCPLPDQLPGWALRRSSAAPGAPGAAAGQAPV